MRNSTILKSYFRWGLLMILASLIYACNKDDVSGPPTSLTSMGSGIRIVHADTSLVLEWDPGFIAWEGDERPTTMHYEVTVSQDSTFEDESQNVFDFETDSTSLFLGEQEIVPLEKYFARVRTVASSGTGSSSWAKTPSFQLRPINIWKPIKVGNLSDEEAILNWKRHGELTDLVVKTEEGADVGKFNVKDASAVSQLLEGLTSNHNYVAELFRFDGRSLGTLTFKTKPTVEQAGYRYVENPEGLEDILNTVPDGSVIALKRGVTYPITSTKVLDRSVTILSEPGLSSREPRATIKMSSSFDIAGNVSLVKFEDVAITGDMGATYVFNLSAVSNIDRIEFESCLISDQRGVLRLKDAGLKNVNTYVINNSIVQNIEGYNVLMGDHADASVGDVFFTNSTFINIPDVIRWGNTIPAKLKSVVVSNSTFFGAPNATSKYFINTQRTGSNLPSLTISNTLFGWTLGARPFNGNNSIPKSVSVTNSFATSDSYWDRGVIPGVTVYSATSSQVFAAPDMENVTNSDLTIIDEKLQDVGDPRWRP